MTLITSQPLDNLATPSFTAPSVSDTFQYAPGLIYVAKIGGTTTTSTVVVPGTEPYSGGAKDDLTSGAVSNTEKWFRISERAADPATGLVTVTHSQVTGVTAALVQVRGTE
jgi:hypothetical protein